ncbi:MAG TPA: adenylate/guanylate cyclase domain-containing protein [Candidatus Dormibacteraeota bacterium]|nr:adenylate/guanylate cyclase domain-containing protein [Candidatus Dormibacteraeota bacterium]
MIPDIRYVRRDGVSIAYQMFGSGDVDLLCIPGFVSNLEYQWTFQPTAHFYQRLGSFARVTEVDRRGTGLSDRLSPDDLPPLEVLVEDLVAVMDDAGLGRATVFGFLDGSLQAILFAATYPQRTSALVLYGGTACGIGKPDYPWQWSREKWDKYLDRLAKGWGTEAYLRELISWSVPSLLKDEELVRQAISFFRFAANTSTAVALERLLSETDVRHVLSSIHVPTLVMHRTDDANEDVEGARQLARQIDGARFVELPGADSDPYVGDSDAIVDEIEEFLTGARHVPELDRVLATVLFTDIVGSTEKAAELGDSGWLSLRDAHHERVRSQLSAFRGREIDTAGDGFLATFDGPARAVRCAQAIGSSVRALGLVIRAGCHTGEIELMGNRVGGIAVHIGARVAALAEPGEVLVSSTVKDLVAGSGLSFEDRGEHELKGVPDRWRLYSVAPG